jgi:hypothetical protein
MSLENKPNRIEKSGMSSRKVLYMLKYLKIRQIVFAAVANIVEGLLLKAVLTLKLEISLICLADT